MFEGRRLEGEPVADGFVAGFAARHDAAAVALRHAFAERPKGFAPADLIARIDAAAAKRGGDAGPAPRHFSPADPSHNPTAGWDPLDANLDAASGFIDPVEAAHAAGYAEGLAAARVGADQAAERDRTLVAGLLDQLRAGDRVDREAIANRLRQTVLLLVAKLVGEAGISADLLASRIAAAAELLADASESAMLRVNPEDVALLDGRLPKSIFAVGDAAVARGSFVLEAASTVVEDGPALWLEQLERAIDRLPVPR